MTRHRPIARYVSMITESKKNIVASRYHDIAMRAAVKLSGSKSTTKLGLHSQGQCKMPAGGFASQILPVLNVPFYGSMYPDTCWYPDTC